MNTVSLCMIVKNEQSNIANLLDLTCPTLEEVVIVDTGSTDSTINILREKQAQYPNLKVENFTWIEDFSAARNFAFSKATQDWVFWMDGDDLVDPTELKRFKDSFLDDPTVDCWILDYVYSRYPNGSPQTVLGRERFLRRSKNPNWIGAIHETVAIWGLNQRYYGPLKIIHNQEGKVIDPDRNIRILESEFNKNPNDPRTAYYYGKELFDRVNPKGIEILNHFVSMPSKYWDDEINARFRLACHDLVNNRLTEALHHAEAIYHLDSSRMRAEGYWIYGRVEQALQNHKIAIKWFERCLDGEPGSPRVINREYYTWNPMFRLAECYRDLGDLDNAIRWHQKIGTVIPFTNPMVVELEDSIFNKFFSDRPKIIEQKSFFHDRLRPDSFVSDFATESCYFGDKKFDGLVIHNDYPYDFPNIRLVKLGGFVWTRSEIDPKETRVGYIGKAVYNGAEMHNYVVSDPSLPTFTLPSHGDTNFGPYRIRIDQLRKSLVKNGYRLVDQDADFFVTQNLLSSHPRAKFNILDVCEWLPGSDYSEYGVEFADAIVCSSPLLTEKMKAKFPNKPVMCVEDHVDFTDQDWL
jgi:glycosyltransferase involved in cell wall biosynthesis